jgi:1-acyl-sn-glycerol-3-phosphate acyltransferase
MFFRLGRLLFRIFFRAFCRARVVGADSCPRHGPLILAPNHVSYLDPPLVGCAVPRPVWFMAKHELFKIPVLGPILPHVHAFPVRRGRADRAALRKAEALINEGKAVVVFPEGARQLDGDLGSPELGIGFIALRTRAPVLPIGLIGSNEALPSHSILPRPARIEVRVGPPLMFPDLYGRRADRAALEEVGRRVMAALRELLD